MTARPHRHAAVLVVGEESRVVLPIIRSLGARGIPVDLAWCPPDEPAIVSRFLRRAVPATDAPPHDLDGLVALHTRERYGLVIPATDSATHVLHHGRGRWAGILPVAIGPAAALDIALDKLATWELARRLDVPVPRSRVGSTPVEQLLDELSLPLVVKPASSVDPHGLGKRAVRIVETPDELRAATDGRVLVQELVPGHGEGIEVLADRGRVLLAFQHRRLHETTGYGSTYRESVPVDPSRRADVERLVAELDYTGVAMFEYRVDPPSGRAVLLEINPRFWGSLPLSVAAGADFPLGLYHVATTNRHDLAPTDRGYRVGLRSRDLLNDLRWTLRQVAPGAAQGDDAAWRTARVGRARAIGDLLRLLLPGDRTDLFAWTDPRPAGRELRRIARFGAGTFRR